MNRKALLFANSVSYGVGGKNITKGLIQGHLREIASQLSSLGDEHSFESEYILDKPTAKAREILRKEVKQVAKKQGSTLLLYYFGHALRHPSKNELYFYAPDSDPDDPGGMLRFSEIADWLNEYQPANTVVILDCCFAGTVADQLQLSLAGNFYLMASVNAKDKALVDYSQGQAFGAFSKFALQAFSDPNARDNGRIVTFKSFFDFAKARTESAISQAPYSVDKNLANGVFFQQTSQPIIPDKLRESVPKKSIYRKLFLIGSSLLDGTLTSEAFVYEKLKKQQLSEFLQPFKTSSNVVKYKFVSPDAFHRYIRVAKLLGILENSTDNLLRLTAPGREMMTHKGRLYNRGLFDLVDACWQRYKLKLSDFEDAIYLRIKRGDAPSLRVIHRDLALSGRVLIPKDLFQILFDLTGYVGALNYSAEKTFFPPASEQERLQDTDW